MVYPMTAKDAKPPMRPAPTGFSQAPKAPKKPGEANAWLKGLVTLIIVLIIVGGGIYLIASYTGVAGGLGAAGKFKENWQAIFLTNGQVYFGKVPKITSDFVLLRDIYYLQVVNQQNTIGQPSDVQTQPEQRLTLIKLGNEIHGPRDEMMINRDHVVLMEDLKSSSRVVEAINDYLKKQSN